MKTVIYPYIPAMINRVELWLMSMSLKGYQLINVHGWKFIFKEISPRKIEYFMYGGFDASKGISNDYINAKERYGNRKSKINKQYLDVFEIDEKKKDEDFNIYINLRNRYYFNHYLKLFIFSILLIVADYIMLSTKYLQFELSFIIILIMFIYSTISIIILLLTCK